MAYKTVLFQTFGAGWNLAAQPDVLKPDQAIDLLNVDFTDVGGIRQRDGYAKLTSSALTNRADSLFQFVKSDGSRQILAGAGTRLEALSTAGAVLASATGLSGGPWSFAEFGTPNATVAYAGNGTDTLRKWDGSAWSAPTATVNGTPSLAMPKGRLLAAWGERLVVSGFDTTTGGPNGTTSSPSHLYFSDAANPESYSTASAAVQLRPGDGEQIQGLIAWGPYLFAFKETAFWVFSGADTQSDGSPEYLRRPVDTEAGAIAPGAICAARDGVYFLGRNGVYRTTGGPPQLVSQIIDPFFTGSGASLAFSSTLPINAGQIANAQMAFHRERIYLSVATNLSTNDRTLVFDPRYGWWSVYDLPAAALASIRLGNFEELVFAYATGANDLGRHSNAYADDAGTAIRSYWRSGWFDLGIPNIKTIRMWEVWGRGKVIAGMGYDYLNSAQAASLDFGAGIDTWGDGSGPDVWGDGSEASDNWGLGVILDAQPVWLATDGHVFSLQFDSVSGTPWEVHRVKLNLRNTRDPSIVDASPG